ncbi:Nucleoside-transport system protein nupC [Serratia quinivorans]|nr:Nucleoside-transport system protein nupC [Serratia quinivorans]
MAYLNKRQLFYYGVSYDAGYSFCSPCLLVTVMALLVSHYRKLIKVRYIIQHINLLPIIIRVVGRVLSKVNGMGKLEFFNAVSALFLGQWENYTAFWCNLMNSIKRRN